MTKRIYDEEFEIFGYDDIKGRRGTTTPSSSNVGGYPLELFEGKYGMELSIIEEQDDEFSRQEAIIHDEDQSFLNSIGIRRS